MEEAQTAEVSVDQGVIPEKIQKQGRVKPEAVYQALKDEVYHNMTMLAPNGRVLCRCGPKKVNWYLSRGLATIISEDPLTIQLNFEPGGKGEDGDAYQLAEKDNNCVVCGRDDYNTKHHIVEYEYRQHMPVRLLIPFFLLFHHCRPFLCQQDHFLSFKLNLSMQFYGLTPIWCCTARIQVS